MKKTLASAKADHVAPRTVSFEEWKNAQPGVLPQDVIDEIHALMSEGRAHWFVFAIDADGKALVKLTEQGRLEYQVERLLNETAGHA